MADDQALTPEATEDDTALRAARMPIGDLAVTLEGNNPATETARNKAALTQALLVAVNDLLPQNITEEDRANKIAEYLDFIQEELSGEAQPEEAVLVAVLAEKIGLDNRSVDVAGLAAKLAEAKILVDKKQGLGSENAAVPPFGAILAKFLPKETIDSLLQIQIGLRLRANLDNPSQQFSQVKTSNADSEELALSSDLLNWLASSAEALSDEQKSEIKAHAEQLIGSGIRGLSSPSHENDAVPPAESAEIDPATVGLESETDYHQQEEPAVHPTAEVMAALFGKLADELDASIEARRREEAEKLRLPNDQAHQEQAAAAEAEITRDEAVRDKYKAQQAALLGVLSHNDEAVLASAMEIAWVTADETRSELSEKGKEVCASIYKEFEQVALREDLGQIYQAIMAVKPSALAGFDVGLLGGDIVALHSKIWEILNNLTAEERGNLKTVRNEKDELILNQGQVTLLGEQGPAQFHAGQSNSTLDSDKGILQKLLGLSLIGVATEHHQKVAGRVNAGNWEDVTDAYDANKQVVGSVTHFADNKWVYVPKTSMEPGGNVTVTASSGMNQLMANNVVATIVHLSRGNIVQASSPNLSQETHQQMWVAAQTHHLRDIAERFSRQDGFASQEERNNAIQTFINAYQQGRIDPANAVKYQIMLADGIYSDYVPQGNTAEEALSKEMRAILENSALGVALIERAQAEAAANVQDADGQGKPKRGWWPFGRGAAAPAAKA